MTRSLRITVTTLSLVAAVVASGWVARLLLRNPLEDLPVDSRQVAPVKKTGRTLMVNRPSAPSRGFVGSAACAQCHVEICETYAGHPMARSVVDVNTGDIVENYDNATFDAPPPARLNLTWRYSVERNSDGTFHHEGALDPSGEEIYDQGVPVHFAVGSGTRGRSYLINRDGLLFMSSISWYSQKSRWNLSPGYLVQNARFERRILEGCVFCHVGQLAPVADQPHRYDAQRPFPEMGIGCERCHGPGEEHVAFRLGNLKTGGADPIVNPAKLEPDQRDSVCYQCHFSGETRIARYGRTDSDFRPGDDLSNIWTVFVRGTGVSGDTTAAVSQTEQMIASACYRKSNRELTCTSCHDAHAGTTLETRIAFYRAQCLKCHEAGAPECGQHLSKRLETTAEDSCIECHMPRIAANDIPHTSQTDHRVLRSYHRSAEEPEPAASVLSIFQADSGRVPATELERAQGLLIVRNAERRGDPVLANDAIPKLLPWLEAAPDDLLVAESLGVAYWLNKEMELARDVWERALTFQPNHEDILRRLAKLYHDTGKIEEGIVYSRRLIALNPWHHEDLARLAHMLGQNGDFDEAIRVANQALEINPLALAVHAWLAEVYTFRGEHSLSQRHQQMYKKLTSRR